MIKLSTLDFAGWRQQARALLAAGVNPAQVVWESHQSDLLGTPRLPDAVRQHPLRIPRQFVDLAETVSLHRSPSRWQYLYRMAFRLVFENRHLLDDPSDPDSLRLRAMAQAIAHDVHKMHAFVRFRAAPAALPQIYISWYEPDHYILEHAAPFFVNRFPNMCWSILTPDGCLHWDGRELAKSAAVDKPAAEPDDLEQLWLTYYRSIFNPARLNERGMTRSMPVRFWRNLPEARALPELLQSARATTGRFLTAPTHTADTARRRSRAIRTLQDRLREPISEIPESMASEILEPMAQARSGPGLDFIVDIERHSPHGGGERA